MNNGIALASSQRVAPADEEAGTGAGARQARSAEDERDRRTAEGIPAPRPRAEARRRLDLRARRVGEDDYFTTTDRHRCFQYHPLFRKFLVARAMEAFSPDERAELKRAAAAKLRDMGRTEDAAALLVEVGDWGELGRIVAGSGAELLRQGRNETLEKWLRAVPADVLGASPWLLYWLGVAVLPMDLAESRGHLEAAFQSFRSKGEAAGTYLSWCGVVDTHIYDWANFTHLDPWIADGEALRKGHPEFPSPEIEARFTYGMFCALMYRRPDHPDMSLWEERARALALGSGDIQLRVALSGHLVWYHSWSHGDQSIAMAIVNSLREAARAHHAPPPATIAWCAFEGALCFLTADAGRCAALVEEGLELAETTGIHVMDFQLSLNGCWNALSTGDLVGAERYLRQMSPIVNTKRTTDMAMYQITLAWRYLCEGDSSLALQHARAALALAQEAGIPLGVAAMGELTAEPLAELGRHDTAAQYLEEAHRLALRIGSKTCQYQYWWLKALIELRRGDASDGLASLRRYLAISKESGIDNHLWWRSSVMSELYARALEEGIETDWVRRVIRKRSLAPPSPDAEGWPWRVEVRTLGGFELKRDGEIVEFGRKSPRKPLELLQALVACGGERASERDLVDFLWSDADGDAAQHTLETTIYRLRKVLGSPRMVVQNERAVSLESGSCWTDVRALQRRLAAARADLDGAQVELAAVSRHAERALQLYRGPFLPAVDAEWALEARERLRSQVGRFVRAAARRLEAAGKAADASDLLRRALEADREIGSGTDG